MRERGPYFGIGALPAWEAGSGGLTARRKPSCRGCRWPDCRGQEFHHEARQHLARDWFRRRGGRTATQNASLPDHPRRPHRLASFAALVGSRCVCVRGWGGGVRVAGAARRLSMRPRGASAARRAAPGRPLAAEAALRAACPGARCGRGAPVRCIVCLCLGRLAPVAALDSQCKDLGRMRASHALVHGASSPGGTS